VRYLSTSNEESDSTREADVGLECQESCDVGFAARLYVGWDVAVRFLWVTPEEKRMDRLGDRISTLEARLKQLKARQSAVEARKRTVAQRRQRRDDVRRNILVGTIVLEKVASGEFEKAKLWGWLQVGVTREEDRRLFEGLAGDGNGEGAVRG